MEYYNDYFSSDPNHYKWTLWREEADRWLEFFHQIDPEKYNISKSRVRRTNERDAFMAEMKALYFLGTRLGLGINEVEPKGGLLDFSLTDKDNMIWNVEVKGPIWKGQVMRDSDLSLEARKDRIKRDKYINAEGEWFNSFDQIIDALEYSIQNSLHKFESSCNNLLVICPDLKHSIHTMLGVEAMQDKNPIELLKQLVEVFDTENKISCVLLLETSLPASSGQIYYDFVVCPVSKTLQY